MSTLPPPPELVVIHNARSTAVLGTFMALSTTLLPAALPHALAPRGRDVDALNDHTVASFPGKKI